MWGFIGQRILGAIPVLFGITVLVFSILHLMPGSPAQTMLFGTQASPEQVAALNQQLGVDRPLVVQYADFLGNLLRGDLGTSFTSKRPVASEISSQLPGTLLLAGAGMFVALIIGFPAGILAALKRGSWIDSFATGIAVLGVAIPNFWLAILLMLLFSVKLNWFPVLGQGSLRAIVLPAIALGWGFAAIITRLVRANMIEVLNQPYITTARAKGLGGWIIIVRHALRNALIPVVTILGLQIANLLSGAVVIESIFARQGIGSLAVRAILSKDVPLVQGIVVFVAVIYIIVNLVVDLCYTMLDPRIRNA